MARKDWRPYYCVAWDSPAPVEMYFLKKDSAYRALHYFKIHCRGFPGPKPIGVLAVIGKTPKIQQQLWVMSV